MEKIISYTIWQIDDDNQPYGKSVAGTFDTLEEAQRILEGQDDWENYWIEPLVV